MTAPFRGDRISRVVSIESRGFLLGAPIALALEAGLVPMRKPGKLPAERGRVEYALEYGTDALEMHSDAVGAADRVLIVDDVLATGGTAAAAAQLVRKHGAGVVGCTFLIELDFLHGRGRLTGGRIEAYLGMIGGVVAVLFVWYLWSNRTAERTAGAQLEQARLAVDSRNFGLAASELARLVENYAGTRAAQEGTILLAQVRLAQGQNQLAIDLLKRFAPDAGKAYQAQAYGLLGAAYENAARRKDAAEAYQRAAEVARLPFLHTQFLSDAGRAWVAAGDTARALAAYRAILQGSDTAGAAVEAKVRIGELTRGAVRP